MQTKILKLNNDELKQKLFWIFSLTIFLLVCLYIYFIVSTIKNVVAIEIMEIEKTESALAISTKEFKFISMRNNITLDLAKTIGFQEIKEQNYITTKSISFVVENDR
jgi:hypothetical protein